MDNANEVVLTTSNTSTMPRKDYPDPMQTFRSHYPWTQAPLIVGAPMRLISLEDFATEISKAGGLGFVGAGNDATNLGKGDLESVLREVRRRTATASKFKGCEDILPIGVGFLCWGGEKLLHDALAVLEKYLPAAVWLFAPYNNGDLELFTTAIRLATHGKTKIWIQIGSAAEAYQVTATCQPDVLVVQGGDAGGHGLHKAAGLIPLFPEVENTVHVLCETMLIQKPFLVAAGGIVDARTAAAALALGACGVVMGTRYLACPEAKITQGYRSHVLAGSDGGQSTERTKLYDGLRGTTDWPVQYGGRGLLNQSYNDEASGMSFEENKRLYDEALQKGDEGWGREGRLTTYAGTGVGLVKREQSAAQITEEVRMVATAILAATAAKFQ